MKKASEYLRKLASFTHKIEDPYNKGFFTTLEAFVPKPTQAYPLPCILISIRNGHQKLFFRVNCLKAFLAAFKVPKGARLKLSSALVEANHEADRIEEDCRLLFAKRQLAPGGEIVRTDTNEVLAQAEKLIKERRITYG